MAEAQIPLAVARTINEQLLAQTGGDLDDFLLLHESISIPLLVLDRRASERAPISLA